MEPLLTRLLDHYSLTEEGLAALSAEPSFSLLPDLSDSLAALEAKSAIASTIAGKGKILVYGDYDCDGIMATSIMVRTLSALGARVEYFIPSRYKDGYGLTLDNAKKIAAKDFALLILVDNGVSCLEPVAYLLEKGLKTIIIDHHDLPVSLPPSLALIHDQLLAFPDKCSAGALCFFFSRLLLGYDEKENAIMGAISILSDLMPMKGYNRTLVALSLRLFRQGYGQAFLPLMEGDIIDERTLSLKANSKILIDKAVSEGKGLEADVEALYYGNQYFLFVYRVFRDIRLVGAPPSSIGKFGGDTDNWMWPRHTGDFSIFRIYADKDNNPAEYSENNVPYTPRKYFRISLKGVKEGDFTFVYGYPGSTREYILSEGVRYISEISDPHKIGLRSLRLDIQDRYMSQSQAVRIQYSSKNAGVANSWKKWQGEMRGIRKMDTVEKKREYEKRFEAWAAGTEYEGITDRLDSLYRLLEPYSYAADYYNETARIVELSRFATGYADILHGAILSARDTAADKAAMELERLAEAFYKDYFLPIDKESFIAVMDMFDRNVPAGFKPEYFVRNMSRYGTAEIWADSLFGNSVFADSSALAGIVTAAGETGTGADITVLTDDPAVEFGRAFDEWYREDILPVRRRLSREITLLYRDYMKGQMEFEPGKEFYPDANLTLRVAYGSVRGYSPADGTYYLPSSTIEGIMQKDNPEIFDYDVPERLREIYRTKDYGRWGISGADGGETVPVCFIATNHTSGGNSGSPVINADGDLIGINFDRVWEGTMSDIVFDPDLCRNIALDIRYVLFVIDRVAGASHLIDEMSFSE